MNTNNTFYEAPSLELVEILKNDMLCASQIDGAATTEGFIIGDDIDFDE